MPRKCYKINISFLNMHLYRSNKYPGTNAITSTRSKETSYPLVPVLKGPPWVNLKVKHLQAKSYLVHSWYGREASQEARGPRFEKKKKGQEVLGSRKKKCDLDLGVTVTKLWVCNNVLFDNAAPSSHSLWEIIVGEKWLCPWSLG